MRRRTATAPTRVDDPGVRVEVVPVDAARLVTLDEVGEVPPEAEGAFCRLRPPEDTPAADVASWASAAREKALAVRVVPVQRSAAVPVDFARPGGSVRGVAEEAVEIARESGDPELLALVERVLAEVRR